MGGKGTFFDPRLDDAAKFPIAAAKGFGHVFTDADHDLITSKLPALHVYQLAIPAPKPQPNVHFDPAAAARGDLLLLPIVRRAVGSVMSNLFGPSPAGTFVRLGR